MCDPFIMDNKAFNKIKPEDQVIVSKIMGDVFRELDTINRQDNEKARNALQQQGVEFLRLTSDEKKRWQKISVKSTVMLKEKGQYSEKMHAILTDLLQEYRKKNP